MLVTALVAHVDLCGRRFARVTPQKGIDPDNYVVDERPELYRLSIGRRSAFGLIPIYNQFPANVILQPDVQEFQRYFE